LHKITKTGYLISYLQTCLRTRSSHCDNYYSYYQATMGEWSPIMDLTLVGSKLAGKYGLLRTILPLYWRCTYLLKTE